MGHKWDSVNMADSALYEVESILAKKFSGRGISYLVHWKKFSSDHDSWEPFCNLKRSCQPLIDRFNSSQNCVDFSANVGSLQISAKNQGPQSKKSNQIVKQKRKYQKKVSTLNRNIKIKTKKNILSKGAANLNSNNTEKDSKDGLAVTSIEQNSLISQTAAKAVKKKIKNNVN